MVSRDPWTSDKHWLIINSELNHRHIINFHRLITDLSLIFNNSSMDSSLTHHWRIMIIDFHRLITDYSLTHHRGITDFQRLIIDFLQIITDSSTILHRLITDSLPTNQRFFTDSSPIHYRPITDSSSIHHRLITDSSPTHHWRIMIIDFHRLNIDASIYTESSRSAATTFCSEDILQRLHSAPTTFCNKYKLVDFEWKTNNNIMNESKCCILFINTKISLLRWAIQEQNN